MLYNRRVELESARHGHPLTVAEHSRHVARKDEILLAHGEVYAHGGDRRSSGNGSHLKTQAEQAEEKGISPRTLRQRKRIGANLTDEAMEIISEIDPDECDLLAGGPSGACAKQRVTEIYAEIAHGRGQVTLVDIEWEDGGRRGVVQDRERGDIAPVIRRKNTCK
jgi:hypothetical protein